MVYLALKGSSDRINRCQDKEVHFELLEPADFTAPRIDDHYLQHFGIINAVTLN